MSLDALRAEIMLRSRKGECDVVVIDYLHTLAPLTKKGETQESVIRHTITVLKRIAVEANCAMLVVSQLNREVLKRSENGFVPIMSDLRDSGAIDCGGLCGDYRLSGTFREEYGPMRVEFLPPDQVVCPEKS